MKRYEVIYKNLLRDFRKYFVEDFKNFYGSPKQHRTQFGEPFYFLKLMIDYTRTLGVTGMQEFSF
jgi:uncharacterized protein YcgL (UPF0745 family)